MNEDEIQRMVKDAELNAAEDAKKLELVNAHNQLDALVHSVKKSLTEYGDKVSAEEKATIEAAVKDAEEALKTEDKDRLTAQSEALAKVSQKLGEAMYADAQAKAGAAGAGAAGAGGGAGGGAEAGKKHAADDPNVVDAEFTEVKDAKK